MQVIQRGRLPRVSGLRAKLQPVFTSLLVAFTVIGVNFIIPLSRLASLLPIRKLLPNDPICIGRRWVKTIFVNIMMLIHQWFVPMEMHITAEGIPLEELFEKDKRTGDWGDMKLAPRHIIVSNHQVYLDFLYIWLFIYLAKLQASILIFLKAGFEHSPFIGWGMKFFDFVFLHRQWARDQTIVTARIDRLKQGWELEEPVSILIFPEGTVVSENTRGKMRIFAEKMNITELPKHCLLPRVTGLYHILSQLEGSNIEYIYDLTMGLSGITADDIPEDVYRILDCYWKGENASEIHIRVRRWHIPTQVPIQDGPEVFNEWLRARWMEKDEMLKRFYATGSLAVGETESERRLETVIKPMRVRSILWTLVPVFILWSLFWLICRTLFRILS